MTTTPVMVRTSERRLFCECRQHWHWAYVHQRKPKETRFNALVFGDLVHRSLAEYYRPEKVRHGGKGRGKCKRGPHPAWTYLQLHDKLAERTRTGKFEMFVNDEDEQFVNARELGEEMMTNYVDLYGLDERFIIIYPEMPFQFELRDGDGNVVAIYVGTSDAFAFDMESGRYVLLEHKTAASISLTHLFMDEQASTYWTIVPMWLRENGIIKSEDDLGAMVYNFLRKAKKDTRPENEQGQKLNKPSKEALTKKLSQLTKEPVPKKLLVEDLESELRKYGVDPAKLGEPSRLQPQPLFQRELVFRGAAERYNTYDRILAQVHEMQLVRDGELEVYKAPGKHCSFCEFRDVCELHEQDSDWVELMRATTNRWEPYTDHVWSLALA